MTIVGVAPVSRWTMRGIGALSFYDRFATAPMLLTLAVAERVNLAHAVQLVSVYSLCYAIGQPFWGVLSDRLGRVRVLRVALAGTFAASVCSVTLPGYPALFASRAITGLAVGALFPTLLTIAGDRDLRADRTKTISDLQTFTALGTTFATLAAGVIAAEIDWRATFFITAVGTVVASIVLGVRRVHDTARPFVWPAASSVFSARAVWVYFLGLFEGAILLGMLSYLVPALERAGESALVAGLLAATYGVGLIVGAQIMRRIAGRVDRSVTMAIGGGLLVFGFALTTAGQSPALLTVCAIAIGGSNSFLHASLLGWATEVAPTSRGVSVSVFVFSLFLGSAIGTAVTAPLAEVDRYDLIFAAALCASMLLVVLAVASYRMMHILPREGRLR